MQRLKELGLCIYSNDELRRARDFYSRESANTHACLMVEQIDLELAARPNERIEHEHNTHRP